MASKIIMPKQGLQLETGLITQWLHKEGDVIRINTETGEYNDRTATK